MQSIHKIANQAKVDIIPRSNFSIDLNAQRHKFEQLAKELQITKPEDWYKVKISDLLNAGKVTDYREVHLALKELYPDVKWLPWKFERVYVGYWANMQHQREFVILRDRLSCQCAYTCDMNWLAKELKLKTMKDWYDVKLSIPNSRGGRGLMNLYSNSLQRALKAIYPEYPWNVRLFMNVKKGFWRSVKNQRDQFDYVAKSLGIQRFEDWYNVKNEQVIERGGRSVLACYGNSLKKALSTIYPEHKWEMYRFSRISKDVLNDSTVSKSYLDFLASQLKIRSWKDWYRISTKQLHMVHGYKAVKQMGGLTKVLSKYYPDVNWRANQPTTTNQRSGQRWLKETVCEIFPGYEVMEDYNHPDLKFPTGKSMQLDVFVPSISVAFEYQGIQHYKDMFIFGVYAKDYQARDQLKRIACQEANITLIEVPYWWNDKKESLIATVQQARPDLITVPVSATPIPKSPP